MTIGQYADKVISICAAAKYKPSCYDREIPKLMDVISFEDAFEVARAVTKQDSSYYYCHVLGHKLSAMETAKDPSKWMEVVARAPVGVCANGAIHGAFQERFRVEFLNEAEIEKIKPDLKKVCQERGTWNPTVMMKVNCYHAIGHLLMYITNADINESLKLCNDVVAGGVVDYPHLCFDGAFMQIFQPLEPEDFALVYGKQPTKNEVMAYCSKFSATQKGSCLTESRPLYREELQNPDGLVKFCLREDLGAERDRCFGGMMTALVPQLNFDIEKIKNYCLGMPEERQGQCFAFSALRIVQTDASLIDKSIQMCTSAESAGVSGKVSDKCWIELARFSTINFKKGSKEALLLCLKIPLKWQPGCNLGNRN